MSGVTACPGGLHIQCIIQQDEVRSLTCRYPSTLVIDAQKFRWRQARHAQRLFARRMQHGYSIANGARQFEMRASQSSRLCPQGAIANLNPLPK